MHHVEKSIEVDAPISMVYNQWTQFEEFPRFMHGVESVRQLDDKRLHWKAEISGKHLEWDAEIFEQIPDQRVAWRSTSGPLNTGMVNFESLGPGRTRVYLKLNYEPEGAMEKMGSAMGVVGSRIEGDLERFRDFIEKRGAETGAWRGRIEGKEVDATQNLGSPGDAMPRSKRIYSEDQTGTGEPMRSDQPAQPSTPKIGKTTW